MEAFLVFVGELFLQLIITFLCYLIITYILTNKFKTIFKKALFKYFWIVLFFVLIIPLILSIYYIFIIAPENARARENLPIKESYIFDFEDPRSSLIWTTNPKANTITTSDDKKLSKSGKNSLCLNVKLQPSETECWSNIVIWNQDFNDVKAITAWVLIPKTEQTSNNRLGAYISAGRYTQKEETNFKSNEIDIVLGKWNKISLDSFSFDELGKPVYSWDGIINAIAVVVWSHESYSGPVYFDDITVYTGVGRSQ